MALNKADADRVRLLPLFNKVSNPALGRLAKCASIQHVSGRTVLFNEGNRANALYTLLRGSVELCSELNERRSTIAIISSIKSFILTSIVDDTNQLAARTLERSELLLLPLQLVHELIGTDASFARTITYALAEELRDVIEDCKNHRLRTTIERLAEWVLQTDERGGCTGHFIIPYGKRTLAAHLGMAPENLSRNLAALAQLGVVVRGRHVSLNDRAALARVARDEGHTSTAARRRPPSISVGRLSQPTLAPMMQSLDTVSQRVEP